MGIYVFVIWVILAPILVLMRKPSLPTWLNSALLVLPIFCFVAYFVVSGLISRNDNIEDGFLWFFYALGIVVTYTAWWEIAWRWYHKQWSKKFFGEYFMSNTILLMSIWPTFIMLLILSGLILGFISDVGKLPAALGLILFYVTGELMYNIIHFLVCLFDSHC